MGDQQRFVELFKASGISQRDLSQRSGVSEATISRVLNGGNCQTDTLDTLIAALEGQPQALKPAQETTSCARCYAAHQQLIAEKDRSREQQTKDLKDRVTSLQRLAGSLGAIILLMFLGVVIVLIIDVSHGGLGWIRYSATHTARGILDRILMSIGI